MFTNSTLSPSQISFTQHWTLERPWTTFAFAFATIIVVLSPVAVAGNALILAAIWKKTFARTPFHILLSGLAFNDLCTGLIAQPFYAADTFIRLANPSVESSLIITIKTIGECSTIYFISLTSLLITLMSVERWLHMSRRSLVTSRGGYLTVVVILLLPIPSVVFRILVNENETDGEIIYIISITLMFSSYLITSFSYFKVYRIIRHHQLQVQANETSQNFGRQAIDLAKYKKSVASMLYILALFSFCFLPFIICSGVFVSVPLTFETLVTLILSVVFLFLSSSLNPALYVWRMNDIRSGVKQLFCRNS